MPLQATSGAASYDAFGGGVAAVPQYIEEVFSTYLYTGTGATQAITNGIDLAVKGGLVWIKKRNGATHQCLFDTVRGVNNSLSTNNGNATSTQSNSLTAFNSTGFSLGSDPNLNVNDSYQSIYASWTFREQPKFFDVVTYTGDGTNSRSIAHNLGSTPGFIILKSVSTSGTWTCYHRSLGTGKFIDLNSTGGVSIRASAFPTVSSTSFVPTSNNGLFAYNTNGTTYVAYVFAHDAGGFGLTGTDNVISCGSYTGNGSTAGPVVTLGYEPQWLMIKNTSSNGYWTMVDAMRGLTAGGNDATLLANTIDSENAFTGTVDYCSPTATGFQIKSSSSEVNTSGNTYIYIAIRRGPMKVPTSGTSVFSPNLSAASIGTAVTTGFPVDLQMVGIRPNYMLSVSNAFMDRLRGVSTNSTAVGNFLAATSTNAEVTNANEFRTLGWGNTGYNQDAWSWGTGAAIYWNFRRAPSFFDVVCYTGTGSATTVTHNLTVTPELIICKRRNSAGFDWLTYCAYLNGGVTPQNWWVKINGNSPQFDSNSYWNDTSPTSTVFSLGTEGDVNASGGTYVAYLFATCAGVSKVGSYTGTGTTKQVDCGFTGGARFVLIKRTDSTGDWYVWDSARGIVAGNDPYLLLNSTAAEVTSTDYIDTYSAGFEISSTAPAAINASGGTFIFLAIA